MKKMFVVMEVKEIASAPDRVYPINRLTGEGWLDKSRVIYADEMEVHDYASGNRDYWFKNISPSPEPEDEWEVWKESCPLGYSNREREELVDWLRKMPKREKL